MKKVNSKINKNGRRGFTMVELVVALAIIAIVSIATVLLIITQTNMNAKSIQVVEATNVAENAIECFRYAVNNPVNNDDAKHDIIESFEKAFNEMGYELNDSNGIYEINEHGAKIKITINATDKTITINAIASDGDVIIKDKIYSK